MSRAQADQTDHDAIIEANEPVPGACWVGMYEGQVAATDRSLGRLIARMKKNGIAVEEATFRLARDRTKVGGR